MQTGWSKNKTEATKKEVSGYVNLDDYISGSSIVSDDLDIWDEYLDEKEKEEEELLLRVWRRRRHVNRWSLYDA